MRAIKNKADFQTILNQNKPILLDFYADWCGPCQMQLPIVERLSNAYGDDIIVAKVNVDEVPELAQDFQIRSIPALFFLQDGQIQERLVGLQTQTVLDAKIKSYTSLEVNKSIIK